MQMMLLKANSCMSGIVLQDKKPPHAGAQGGISGDTNIWIHLSKLLLLKKDT